VRPRRLPDGIDCAAIAALTFARQNRTSRPRSRRRRRGAFRRPVSKGGCRRRLRTPSEVYASNASYGHWSNFGQGKKGGAPSRRSYDILAIHAYPRLIAQRMLR
jgi:hypothetical protein